MNISIPKPEKHHELAGGSVTWVNANGRIRVRKILTVYHDGVSDVIILGVRADGEPQPGPDTAFTFKRNIFE